jgi:hypothetical protein
VLLIHPELPSWLPDITRRGLQVGRSTLTIQLWRVAEGSIDYRILERRGGVRVLRGPPESSVHHGVLRRLAGPIVAALHGEL